MTEVMVAAPANIEEKFLARIESFIIDHGQVRREGFAPLLRRAHALAWALEDGVLVGVAALKQPRSSYRKRVFESAAVRDNLGDIPEVGWVAVDRACRSRYVATRLVAAVIRALESGPQDSWCFATARAKSRESDRLLVRAGFRRRGMLYNGSTDEPMALYLRPARSRVTSG